LELVDQERYGPFVFAQLLHIEDEDLRVCGDLKNGEPRESGAQRLRHELGVHADNLRLPNLRFCFPEFRGLAVVNEVHVFLLNVEVLQAQEQSGRHLKADLLRVSEPVRLQEAVHDVGEILAGLLFLRELQAVPLSD